MGWEPKRAAGERILGYGDAGTGKSGLITSVAAKVDEVVTVFDTDYSFDVLEADYEEVTGKDNLDVRDCDMEDWNGFLAAVQERCAEAERGEWICVDSMTPTWDCVQDQYTKNIFGQDIETFFTEARKATKSKSLEAFAGAKDWTVINTMYFKLYKALQTTQAHVLMTAEPKATDVKNDARDIQSLFGRLGSRPMGQKKLAFVPHTVLLLKNDRDGHTLTTVKDRGVREYLVKEPYEEGQFAMTYLWKVGGWRPARKTTE